MENEFQPLYRITEVNDETVENLYTTWLITKAEYQHRGYRIPKDFKKNKRLWNAFWKIAKFLNGTEVEPRQFFIAQLMGWKEPYPNKFISDKAIANYEAYYKKVYKSKDYASEINKSFKWVSEYCTNMGISFDEYPFYYNGKTRVSVIHIQTGMLSPAIILIHPRYDEWIDSLDVDIRSEVMYEIENSLENIKNNIDAIIAIKEKYF